MRPQDIDSAVAQLAAFVRERGVAEIGVHLVPSAELFVTRLAARSCGAEIVGLGARPRLIVTGDAAFVDGILRLLKDEVDAAVPDAETVIVARLCGEMPLAPTLDAYLEVPMIRGRDLWFEDVCPAGYVGASG